MMPFSRRIRSAAARIMSATTMERLVDPILTDIELESGEHLQRGRVWRARWVVLSGYLGLSKALLFHTVLDCAGACVFDNAAARTVRVSCLAFAVLTTALVLPPLFGNRLFTRHPGLAVYLVPQAIPISIPIALSIGIVWGWSQHTARLMVRRLVVISTAGAVISLATMEWLVPAAHDGFLASLTRLGASTGSAPTMERGVGERSLSELSNLVRQIEARSGSQSNHKPFPQRLRTGRGPSLTAADVKHALHVRLALGAATFLLPVLAVAIASAVRGRKLGRAVFAAVVLLYVVSWFGAAAIAPAVPPALSAWLPNAAVVTVALGFVFVRTRLSWRREVPTN
jgi:lipopolysaccharide export LptBFGC system permease protein LptF